MKKEFYSLKGTELEKHEGEYDAKNGVYFYKADTGWKAIDSYSGSSIVIKMPTKEECKKELAKIMPKVKEVRQSEKFLKGVVNYQEMLEDIYEDGING